MKDNSFTKVENLLLLEKLVKDFQPSIAIDRIDYWMNIFFRFNKGTKSTRSKLMNPQWYTSQTEISTNIIFKSAKFANSLFQLILNKHHTIGLPDKLTEVFSLKENPHNSKTTQNKNEQKELADNPTTFEQAYTTIDENRRIIMKE